MTEPALSLIICTYNRAAFVRRLLLGLLWQCAHRRDVEIVIVDNNSRDDTQKTVAGIAENNPFVRYVFEGEQGLSNARNRGAAEARGAHLLFLDDDALVPDGFVARMLQIINEFDPDFFGGPIFPIYADRLPRNFPEHLEVRKKAASSGFHRDVTMSGGNFGVRKATLDRLGGFNPRFGMSGDKVGMLEERLLVDAYKESTPVLDQRLYYAIDGELFHHTPAQRLTYEFQATRIAVADYQMTRHILAQGVRSPQMYYRAACERLTHVIGERIQTLISPKPDATARFASRIQVARTWAVWKACLDHRVGRLFNGSALRRVQREKAASLRLLWLQMPERGSTARSMSREAKDHAFIAETLAGLPVSVEVIAFDAPQKNKELNRRIIAASPNSFDAILFEQELPEGTAKISRAHYPHLQYLVRLNRTKLMTVIDNIDFSVGRLRAIKRSWPAIQKALAKDRASVRYADLVILSSRWERDFYLRLFGPRRKFACVAPCPPRAVCSKASAARSAGEQRAKRIVVVGDVAPSQFENRQAYRAAAYLDLAQSADASLADWSIVHCGKRPEGKLMRGAKILAFMGIVEEDEYFGLLSSSAVMAIGDIFRSGHPSRLAEGALSGAVIVAPTNALKRLDPILAPFSEGFSPRNPQSLASALKRAATRERDWDSLATTLESAGRDGWRRIVLGCLEWVRPKIGDPAPDNGAPTRLDKSAAAVAEGTT